MSSPDLDILGAVATGHPLVTDVAAATLRDGGNAFDAAVAAGFASAVAEPGLTSLGGGGFLLAATPDAAPVLFDFFVDTPGRALPTAAPAPQFVPVTVRFGGADQTFHAGIGAAAVPGTLFGYLHVHNRLGRLPLSQVLEPAASLARTGVELNRSQAHVLSLLEPIMLFSEPARAIFAPSGRLLGEGDTMRNGDLGAFIESLASGAAESLRAGDLARRVDADMRAGGGLLTGDDLAAYRVIERTPLTTTYRNCTFLTNPPPSAGGSLIAISLALLERYSLRQTAFLSPDHLLTLAAVLAEVEQLRARGIERPDQLTRQTLDDVQIRRARFNRGTTHISVADAHGNIASMTTSTGEGCGYIIPGTGIMLNNMMGEDDLHPGGYHSAAPGTRVASMMSPSILIRDGRPVHALGSGGSKRIRTAMAEVISHIVDFDQPLARAIEAPRIHWEDGILQIEPGLADESLSALQRAFPSNRWTASSVYFGGVHAIAPCSDAAADPRRQGAAQIVRR